MATRPRPWDPEEADEPSYAPELQTVTWEGDGRSREQQCGSRAPSWIWISMLDKPTEYAKAYYGLLML